ncbi:MAG: putative transcriptional regulator [Candidatus Accumulibacter sp. SK-11]|nr:MAG: putative transcriptional regulator [Candidatus Accumulibacter sp. SK-11]HAY28478.1 AlpA family phage regulatory protein [Accumulibacter sp.]HRL78072.1 AlpA family phage regulatory protein [Candidatus Accumulibacter phosphatis]
MARHSNAGAVPEALKNFDFLPDSANVRAPVVAALFGVSAATVWRKAKAGKLPAPRRISDRVTVWNVGEIRASLNAVA